MHWWNTLSPSTNVKTSQPLVPALPAANPESLVFLLYLVKVFRGGDSTHGVLGKLIDAVNLVTLTPNYYIMCIRRQQQQRHQHRTKLV